MASLHLPSNAPVKNGLPPQELLDDLCSRFVLNVPKEDLQSFERILFLVEYAHWFYEDNSCLLVKGWKGSSWSFPRGKKSKDEEDHACAIREVLEETGFDVTPFLIKEDFIEVMFGQQRVRLYIIAGVKNDTAFAPLTKKEISEIAWHRLDDLLPVSDDVISHGITGLKLYMVAPFLESLRSWILKHQPPVAPNFDMPVKGYTMWKVKNTSMSNSSIIFDNQPIKLDSDPGRSLKNFKFDTASILQAMESAFAA
ncbi:mRNA-decapping enzyme subunit 2-like isoform X3 [Cucumis melo]|uniref:mRNA-decapping enzyme subunit 2-like isoform X3 n=1 Tax=Cucumis melo TaxID=3656 RepID=A0ABM3LA92_CUCME|nr:mRNA-decapping enzyme subunit 2-like isoform X3 [Cucumis melo]